MLLKTENEQQNHEHNHMKNQPTVHAAPNGFTRPGSSWKRAGATALVCLATLAASAAIRNNITLMPGTVAGQDVSNGNYQITVAPGAAITGSFDVRVHNEMPSSAIAPVAAAPSWGNPQTNYWGINSWAPTGDSTQHVTVNLTAPAIEGVYYVFVAMAGTYNYDQLMSGTHPAFSADWTNGNKLASLPRCDFETAAATGWLPFNWYTPTNPQPGQVAMAAIRVIVSPPYPVTVRLQSGTLAGQSIDSTHREILVLPGAPLSGSFTVNIHNGIPSSAIVPVAATTTWGNPVTSYWGIDPSLPTGDSTRTVTLPANLVAPTEPGTYYIAVAMAGTYNYEQIVTGTHPAYSADWAHGNLLARLPACDFEMAARLGFIPFNWYVPPSSSSPGAMAMATVKIQVVPPVPLGVVVAETRFEPYRLELFDTISQTNSVIPLSTSLNCDAPTWSPDGQTIAFDGFDVVNHFSGKIYTVQPNGSNLVQVSDGTRNVAYPAFSPDGTQLAFIGVESTSIYIANRDGSGLTNISGLPVNVPGVKWSPDGRKLLFDNWGQTYNADLYVFDLTTWTYAKLTHQANQESYFRGVWSPDGTKIVCMHNPNRGTSSYWRVCVMNADGSNPVDLTADWTSDTANPVWSPDGRYILFASTQSGRWDVWSMWQDGRQRTNLTLSASVESLHPDIAFVAPRITAQPQNQVGSIGGSVTLSVAAVGSTALSYQWQFNGVNLPGATSKNLTLSGLSLSQAGPYRVIITDAQGSTTSSYAFVSLLSLKSYAGLTLVGPVPMTYDIDYTDRLNPTGWTPLTTLTVTNSPTVWIDYDSPAHLTRFYRAVPKP
jgi:Tol biopolymer transport system component